MICDADVGDVRAERPHAERDHVHRAPAHAAVEQAVEDLPSSPPGPSSCWSVRHHPSSCEQMNVRSSTRATSLGSERARKLLGRFSWFSRMNVPACDHLLAQAVVLLVGAVAPVDVSRSAELDHLPDPLPQTVVPDVVVDAHPRILSESVAPRVNGRRLFSISADAPASTAGDAGPSLPWLGTVAPAAAPLSVRRGRASASPSCPCGPRRRRAGHRPRPAPPMAPRR